MCKYILFFSLKGILAKWSRALRTFGHRTTCYTIISQISVSLINTESALQVHAREKVWEPKLDIVEIRERGWKTFPPQQDCRSLDPKWWAEKYLKLISQLAVFSSSFPEYRTLDITRQQTDRMVKLWTKSSLIELIWHHFTLDSDRPWLRPNPNRNM